MKSITPVPPPRRKRRNRGRPLPPKPDEIPESGDEPSEGPLRSPARSPKTSDIDERDDDNAETRITGRICTEDAKHDGRKPKEIYEHKVSQSPGNLTNLRPRLTSRPLLPSYRW
jgi:hypothetical protein